MDLADDHQLFRLAVLAFKEWGKPRQFDVCHRILSFARFDMLHWVKSLTRMDTYAALTGPRINDAITVEIIENTRYYLGADPVRCIWTMHGLSIDYINGTIYYGDRDLSHWAVAKWVASTPFWMRGALKRGLKNLSALLDKHTPRCVSASSTSASRSTPAPTTR